MAKLLISCDDYIYSYNGKLYYKNHEWRDFYDRYLRVFEEIKIANRVIVEDKLRPERIIIDNPHVTVHPIPIFHGPKQYLLRYCKIGHALRNAVEECDAAILRLPSTVAMRLSRKVIKERIPYAVEVVFDAHDGAKTSSSIIEKILWAIIDYRMRHICSKADGVSCVTEKYLQRRYFSSKVGHFESHYSTLALDSSFFSAPRKYPDNKTMTIAHVDMQIGLHGRKGADIIIQAASTLLHKMGIGVNIMFAGEDLDNSADKIKEYAKTYGIEGHVSCPGFLSRAKLSQFLDDSDLFVLPTKAEGLPRVIIEAIAKGLPTITTPASGNSELIPKEYLVEFNDVNSLASTIAQLVTDRNAYEEASKTNYEHSLQYEGSILQARRDQFYNQLKQQINN